MILREAFHSQYLQQIDKTIDSPVNLKHMAQFLSFVLHSSRECLS